MYSRRRRGFTLLEIIVVLAIIATLTALVGPAVTGNVSDARSTAAESQIASFALALDLYRLHVGTYPTTDEGLEALRVAPRSAPAGWRGPYLRRAVPADPWGRPYFYRNPSEHDPDSYAVYSLGADGREGGTGDDADVRSWDDVEQR